MVEYGGGEELKNESRSEVLKVVLASRMLIG